MLSGQQPLALRLRADQTFDGFIGPPGSGGARACQLAQALARGRERTPLYLWGSPASGKTHLLHAALAAAAAHDQRAAYLPLRELRAAGAVQAVSAFEQFDLVCVDDLDAVAGDEAAELALFHLYDRLRAAGGRLIVTASATPAALGLHRPELRSRLGWGVVCHLEPLGDADKRTLLLRRAAEQGLTLAEPVADYLLRHHSRDLRDLLTTLDRLERATLAAQRHPTLPFVRELLAQAP
ncbi:DnaA regulatory inactivator Hda [Immundisolibacter sp.]|uniref:DnaA regulatory inactivator Hda n=1 Tax=Immundisolibacter sp. TaxID=1934948 RepID=UPI002611B065|nr:DnaA regulatory inactivator Hda [Immundisolibacter sp.]MDD3650017.1 DnaA regulatory inactivator Hda [Immundisolibacter sp.]